MEYRLERILSFANEDDAAMARLAAGDQHALDSLFARHSQQVHRLTTGILGDSELAEDVVSDTFLAVAEASQRYRPGAFVPWLLRIARNRAIAELRSRRRRAGLIARLTERLSGSATNGCGADLDLQSALSALPEEQRTLLVLRDSLGLDYTEIAAVLGCRADAARGRALRARRALRRVLLEMGWSPDN